MKISEVRIRNFKLLRKIDLGFSTNPQKPLTVIRAENGSGKTSTLQALCWGLYGARVLDDPLVRLSPADWPDKSQCKISVEIDFVHTSSSTVGGEIMTSQTKYMLKRDVVEKPEGDTHNRGQDRVTLFEQTQGVSEPIDAAEFRVGQMLPWDMRDIFFTDGDAAMTFISPQLPDETKTGMVKKAIRSLLGLDMLERVEERISKAQSAVNKRITREASSDELSKITEEIEETTSLKETSANTVTTLNQQIESIQKDLERIGRELTKALYAGSYDQLAHQREFYKRELEEATEESETLKREHQELFQQSVLSWELLESVMHKGYEFLKSLYDKGDIPKAAIPVLKERLDLEQCICGADLSEGTTARAKIGELIDKHRESDGEVDFLSSLYYQSKTEIETGAAENAKKWTDHSSNLQKRRLSVQKRIDRANQELESVKAKLDQINERKIEELRSNEKTLQSSLRKKNNDLERSRGYLEDAEKKLKELNQKQKELRRADERMVGLNAEKAVLNDLQQIVHGTLTEMQGTYLERVSERMNSLFLHMVGADPEQGATFQGAHIDSAYSIVVKTKDNRTLNPDHEVNGASQRALTFAFIWALADVSGVVAPRIIDTPLGMMSGNVKRRALEMVSREAGEGVDRQVVLFLTQSEISHTEDILDSRSGVTSTLVKTDDYPADLVNDPEADKSEIRLCNCTHREYCNQCQRTNHDDFNLSYRTA